MERVGTDFVGRDLSALSVAGAATQRLLTHYASAARELPVMDPVALDPIVESRSANSCPVASQMEGQERRLSSTLLTEEPGHRKGLGVVHRHPKRLNHSAITSDVARSKNGRCITNI